MVSKKLGKGRLSKESYQIRRERFINLICEERETVWNLRNKWRTSSLGLLFCLFFSHATPHVRSQFTDQGSNQCPLHLGHRARKHQIVTRDKDMVSCRRRRQGEKGTSERFQERTCNLLTRQGFKRLQIHSAFLAHPLYSKHDEMKRMSEEISRTQEKLNPWLEAGYFFHGD